MNSYVVTTIKFILRKAAESSLAWIGEKIICSALQL